MNILTKFILLFALFYSYKTMSSTHELFGVGAKSLALGNASSPTDSAPFSLKENPATMSQIKKPIIASSFTNSTFSLIDTDKTPYSSSSGIVQDTYQASKANTQNNIGLAFILPLSPRVALGAVGILPATSLAQIHSFSGNESTYLKYDDRSNKPEIYTALSLDLPYGFAFGVGGYYSITATGQLQLAVSSTGADSRMLLDLAPEFMPYTGLSYTYDFKFDRALTIGASYRGGQKAQTSLDVDVSLESGGLGTIPFETNSSVSMYFDPAIYTLGISYKCPEANGYFAARFTRWEDYSSPIIKLAGDDLDDLTGSSYQIEQIRLNSTFSYHFGVEANNLWRIGRTFLTPRFGFETYNSPMPKHPTSLAILDAQINYLTFGIGSFFDKLGDFFKYPLNLDLGVKWGKLSSEYFTLVRDSQTFHATTGGTIITSFIGANVEF